MNYHLTSARTAIIKRQQVLARMWRNWNPCTVLVGMRNDVTITESSMEALQMEGMMLKLKLQYFGHLMRRVDSLEKTMMLGGIGGRRRRG